MIPTTALLRFRIGLILLSVLIVAGTGIGVLAESPPRVSDYLISQVTRHETTLSSINDRLQQVERQQAVLLSLMETMQWMLKGLIGATGALAVSAASAVVKILLDRMTPNKSHTRRT
jgi:predicted PurR-regulated permease PerM